ncbi:MAG: preprotein translocase subunit SecE [Candidatus Saccharimonadales bacterium]
MPEKTSKPALKVSGKQTVRQRSQQGETQPKRRLRTTAHKASRPISAGHRQVAKLLAPLGFLLVPFKTRPMRFIGRFLATVLFINYFISSWRELRAVEWPNKRETGRLTVAVFMFSIIFGFLISMSDYGLDKLFHKILLH